MTGGCRGEELKTIKTDYLTDYGTEIIVNIPAPKKNNSKLFVIGGDYAKIVQKYMHTRPTRTATDRFFLQYNQGECEPQALGRNKIFIVPKEIAKFLHLDDYKSYTGHSFQPITSETKRRRWNQSSSMTMPIAYQTLRNSPVETSTSSERSRPSLAAVFSTNDFDVTMNEIIIKTEHDDEGTLEVADNDDSNHLQKITSSTENSVPVIPLLPGTLSIMKRKSQYYTGIPSKRFRHLLLLADGMKELSEVKLMLTLRKLRLNEEFEVLGDLFDLDRSMADRYYHESKPTVIGLVNRLESTMTTTQSNHFDAIFEPIIKIEKCDSPGPYVSDPIATNDDDSTTEMNDHDDDYDNFEIDLPECTPADERGWLFDNIKNRTAECSVCYRFYVPRMLNSHMESVHFNLGNLNRTICGLCWMEFDTQKLLKSHQKLAHGGGSYGCDICSKVFASKRYLSVHIMSRHTQLKTYLCDTCGEGFPVQYSLQDHVKRKHMVHGHDCHLCGMKFVTSAALNDHFVARHTDERRFTCEFSGCGKMFKWRSSFKSHRRVHSNDKYECSVCLKRFSFKGNLQNHLKSIHNQIVENKCLTSRCISK